MKNVAQFALIAAIAPAPLVGSLPEAGGVVAGGVDAGGAELDVIGGKVGRLDEPELLLQAVSARPTSTGSAAAAIRRGCGV